MGRTGTAVLFVIILLFGALSYRRNAVWRDGVSLWSDVVAKSPRESRPHNNLGDALIDRGMYREALEVLDLAVKADPWYVEPHYNKAISYIRLREYDMAREELEKVLDINDTLKAGHYGVRAMPKYELQANANLGNILTLKGDLYGAVRHYRAALELSPDDKSIHYNLGLTYKRLGMASEAGAEFEEVLRIDPHDDGAKWNLMLLKRMEKRDDIGGTRD